MTNTKALRFIHLAAITTALTSVPMVANANPWTGFNDEHGSIAYDPSDIVTNPTYVADGVTNITQSGSLYIGSNPNGLDILAGQSVTIDQSSANALFVAKDGSGNSDPTRILGSLSTTLNGAGKGGSVMILDANGIFFGAGSIIDTGGLIASSGQLDNNELINNNNILLSNFIAGTSVEVAAGAIIDIANSGLAAFVAPTAVNRGVITANLGRVQLAGTNTDTTISTVDLYGDGLFEIALDNANTQKLEAVHTGTITAEGGVINMTTGFADQIVDSMVNMDGIATVSSVTQVNGKIILGGNNTGKVRVAQQVKANVQGGAGQITAKAKDIEVATGADIMADNIDINGTTATLDADLKTNNLTGDVATIKIASNAAKIQDGVDIAALNGTVNVEAGTYDENINITQGVNVIGKSRDATIINAINSANGFTVLGDLGNNNVLIEELRVKNAQAAGVYVGSSANLKRLKISAAYLEDNGTHGVAVYGDSVKDETNIVNTLFKNNGLVSTNNGDGDGDGDILFYEHAGKISLGNVGIQGNTNGLADYGIQILGGTGLPNSSLIRLNNVSVSGQYRGSLVGIQRYGDLDLSMTNVKLGGQTSDGNNSVSGAGWGGALFLNNVGSSNIDLGNTEFRAHDNNYIVLGLDDVPTPLTPTIANVDATSATFLGKTGATMTLAENFAVEDKVSHKMDATLFGLVTWNSNNLYATQASETGLAGVVQRGVDISNTGGNLWVEAGTFAGDVNVAKTMNLYGAQKDIDARNRTGANETIIKMQPGGFNITANDVQLNGFEITEGTMGSPGVKIENANGVTVSNNKIHDVKRGVNADGIWIDSGKNGVITKNWIYDIQDDGLNARAFSDGLNARAFSDGLNVNNNLVENVGSTGLEAYRLLGTVSFNNNEVKMAGSDAIRMHRADNSEVLNNNITMDDKGNGIILTNINGVTVRDNVVNNASDGIFVDGGTGNIIDDNDLNNNLNSGVNIVGSTGTQVIDNVVNSTGKYGVLASNAIGLVIGGNGTALRNRISNVQTGVDVSGSNAVRIIDNDIQGTQTGIKVSNLDDAFIDDNSITDFSITGITVENTNRSDVRDNYIQSTFANTNGIDVQGGTFAQIGGDGNALRNRIYDVDRGVNLLADANTTIDGNDFQRNEDGVYARNTNRARSTDLSITDNTFSDGTRAINLRNVERVVIGGTNDANTIFDTNRGILINRGNDVTIDSNFIVENNHGIRVRNTSLLEITNNNMNARTGNGTGNTGIYVSNSPDAKIGDLNKANNVDNYRTGIQVVGSNNAAIKYNDVDGFTLNGVQVETSEAAQITNNTIDDGAGNAILVDSSNLATVSDNQINNITGDGIRTFAGNNLSIVGNNVDNASGSAVLIEDTQSASVNNNTLENSGSAGIRVIGANTGKITLEENTLNANDVGFLLEGGEIDISNLLNPNTITDGTTGMRFVGSDVQLTNDTLGTTIFETQSGNYIELVNDALFNPGSPTNIDGLAVSWDGVIALNSSLGAGILPAAVRDPIEDRIIDFDDNGTLGQIIVGLDLDVSEEDIFALNLFSLNVAAGNVNVTFNGLPPTTQPDLTALTSLQPAAGEGASAEDFANIQPAAGGEEGCWDTIGQAEFEGTVTFNFSDDVDANLAGGGAACGGQSI